MPFRRVELEVARETTNLEKLPLWETKSCPARAFRVRDRAVGKIRFAALQVVRIKAIQNFTGISPAVPRAISIEEAGRGYQETEDLP